MLRTRINVLEAIFGIAMVMALAMPAWASYDDDGCTPGFWKQSHHFDQWVQYTPDDSFDDVFGVPSSGGFTLFEALRAKGGGEGGLQRHAVAALLNAVSPALNFLLTEVDVIAIVQAGYATGDFESAKNLLEQANDEGCPLN